MKNVMFTVAGVIILGLAIATFFYHNQSTSLAMPMDVLLKKQFEKELTGEPAEPEEPGNPEQTDEPEQTLHAEDTIDYSLQNDALHITYDKGENWTEVPVEKEALFGGEYNGSEQELIADSYMLTEDVAAFLFVSGDVQNEELEIAYSRDEGETWQDSVVTDMYPSIRFRKVIFLNEDVGYVIASGDRTMSQEGSSVYLTEDGGESWEATNSPDTTRMLADAGFVDEDTGFLSYGTINPEAPDLYVTQDAGETWQQADVQVPDKYAKIFVSAEVPVKKDDHLTVLLNQGPNGDYQGGNVKGKFISEDNGKTWKFSEEVEPDEPEA